jgi:hypothetical protein
MLGQALMTDDGVSKKPNESEVVPVGRIELPTKGL